MIEKKAGMLWYLGKNIQWFKTLQMSKHGLALRSLACQPCCLELHHHPPNDKSANKHVMSMRYHIFCENDNTVGSPWQVQIWMNLWFAETVTANILA